MGVRPLLPFRLTALSRVLHTIRRRAQTAIFLDRQHGGDVYFAGVDAGPTRFVLRWPRAAWILAPVVSAESGEASLNGVNGCAIPA